MQKPYWQLAKLTSHYLDEITGEYLPTGISDHLVGRTFWTKCEKPTSPTCKIIDYKTGEPLYPDLSIGTQFVSRKFIARGEKPATIKMAVYGMELLPIFEIDEHAVPILYIEEWEKDPNSEAAIAVPSRSASQNS